MADRFCQYEEARFPDDEFESSAEHGWIHNRDPLHTTSGHVIDDDDDGGIPGAMDTPPDVE
jgi:hypothetical protein